MNLCRIVFTVALCAALPQLGSSWLMRSALAQATPSRLDLADAARNEKRFEAALSLYLEELSAREATLGNAHPDLVPVLDRLGFAYRNLARHADEARVFARSLQIDEKHLGPDHADIASDLINVGNAYRSSGEYAKALPLYQRALAIREKVHVAAHSELVEATDLIGHTYVALRSFREGAAFYQRSLAIDEKLHGAEHLDVATDHLNIAEAFDSAADYAQALPYFARATQIREKLLGANHANTLFALNRQGMTLFALGRAAQAVPVFERAYQLRGQTLGEMHRETLASLNNYAAALNNAGRNAEALPHYERALKLFTDSLGERDSDTLRALKNYANALDSAGRSAEALPHYERSLTLRTQTLGQTHPDTLDALSGYAYGLQALGRTAEALPHHERALNLRTQHLGAKHPDTLTSLHNYAGALEALGRPADALPQYERALKLRIEVLGEKHPESLNSLSNYAATLGALGLANDALTHFERALKLRTEVLGEKHPDTLSGLNNYASALDSLGREAQALPYYERALALRTEVLGEKHPSTLNSLNNYAYLLQELGRAAEALPHHARALQLRNEAQGENHPTTVIAMNNYAHSLVSVGRASDALPLYERFITAAERQRDAASRDSEQSQRGVLAGYIAGYHNYLRALQGAGRAREALGILERTKARTLIEQMALRSGAANSGLPAADSARLLNFANGIGTLDTRIAQTTSESEREAYKTQRNSAARELAALKAQLQAQYPRFRQTTEVRLATADDARSLVDAKSLFVSYVVMNKTQVKALSVDSMGTVHWHEIATLPGLADTIEALRMWSANLSGGAMVDDTGRTIQILTWVENNTPRWRVVAAGQACSAQQMREDASAATRAQPQSRGLDAPAATTGNAGADCIPPGASFVSREPQYQQLIDFMGETLLDPLKAQLAGKQQIMISPDGPLGLVPWDVLPLNGKPLIAQFDVSQVQSLSVLKLLKARQAEYGQNKTREALLAMGNPLYGSGGASADRGKSVTLTRSPFTSQRGGANPADLLRNLKWADLPGTQVEMDRAANLFAGQSRVISGKAANETTLRQISASGELANYRYLLFAAHGYFDPNFPAFSSLVLAPEGPEPERDGYVTMGEWVGLNLKSELTLLSACNTARGENISGEGLMGLAYALYVAGNTNTVLTLWPVADEETAEFVSSLLGKIKAGQAHAQAITATKREFLNHDNPRKRSPYFWAPFVLYGL